MCVCVLVIEDHFDDTHTHTDLCVQYSTHRLFHCVEKRNILCNDQLLLFTRSHTRESSFFAVA